MIRLSLPYPPTVNNLFANGKRGRFKTPGYTAWELLAAASLRDQPACRAFPEGPYVITMTAQRPDRRRRDIASIEKATSDLLVKVGILPDDSLAQRIVLQWAPGEPVGKGALVFVEIESA